MWTTIGALLLYRGVTLIKGEYLPYLAAAGLIGGSLKSLLVLDKVSRRGIERIKKFSDNTCIGAVYSWKTWLLVFGMALFGILFRRLHMPGLRGTICVAIGWALVLSSRIAWMSWIRWNDTVKSDDNFFNQ